MCADFFERFAEKIRFFMWIPLLFLCSCTSGVSAESGAQAESEYVIKGGSTYHGFSLNNVVFASGQRIHFNLYVPDSYDGSEPYSLFITLPGYQGLYFQGVGMNIRTEDFGFEAQKYNSKMIIAAPQLYDWGETSASQTIVLTKFLLAEYNIDSGKVYIEGYSGGGETLSLVLSQEPELYTAALMCSSNWDGGFEKVVASRIPLYFVIGKNDEYYGSEPFRSAYSSLCLEYKKAGLSDDEIKKILVLDIKDEKYFKDGDVSNQYGGGGGLFSKDSAIMGWLFGW